MGSNAKICIKWFTNPYDLVNNCTISGHAYTEYAERYTYVTYTYTLIIAIQLLRNRKQDVFVAMQKPLLSLIEETFNSKEIGYEMQ